MKAIALKSSIEEITPTIQIFMRTPNTSTAKKMAAIARLSATATYKNTVQMPINHRANTKPHLAQTSLTR